MRCLYCLGFFLIMAAFRFPSLPEHPLVGPLVLVKNINPTPNPDYSSSPSDFVAIGDMVYFTADDGRVGRELWRSDGTAAGTVRVKDIWPGPEGSDPREFTVAGSEGSDPPEFTDAGSRLFFSAADGRNGRELWVAPLGLGGSAGLLTLRDTGAANCIQLNLETGAYTFTTGSGRQVSGQATVEQRPTALKIQGGTNEPYLLEGTIDLEQRRGVVTLRAQPQPGGPPSLEIFQLFDQNIDDAGACP